jgi:TolB-like protein/Flp pilus assembly protein TadD
MIENTKNPIRIDLNEFKLHLHLQKNQLTFHFDSPSRKFYLSVIALVVYEMKRLGRITSIPLERHLNLLVLLNETIGGSTGSSDKERLLPRIYRKWKDALPDLEDAPLFKVLGRRKEYDEGIGRTYPFPEAEKDSWANLFEYQGSEENVRLKFAIDKLGATLNDIVIVYGDSLNGDAWERFISSLKERIEDKPEIENINVIHQVPVAQVPPRRKWKIAWPSQYRWAALMAVMGLVVGGIALAIWELYIPPASQSTLAPKEKITSLQHKKTLAAELPSAEVPPKEKMIVEIAHKEKGEPPSLEKVSKPMALPTPKIEVASKEKMAFPLPDKPSIAVLPFVNMSEDPEQEFLSDGITENIITVLSKVPRLFVISRQSTFFYRGKPVKVKQVSEDLGVRYVLEGSFQKSGDHVRITAQLIDALTGNHLWAERYDRDLKDIFALQDEITIKILTGVQEKLTLGAEVLRAQKYAEKYYRGKQGLDCYLKIMEGNERAERHNTEDNNLARRIAEEVIAMCPEAPMAYLLMAYVHTTEYYTSRSPQETIEKGIELVQKAIALDDTLAEAHGLLGYLYTQKREYEKGIAEGERAVALNPSGATVLVNYAISLNFAGRSEEAITLFQKALRLNPFGSYDNYNHLGLAFMWTERYEEAVSAFKKAIQGAPNSSWSHMMLAATYSMTDHEMDARAEVAEALRINPKFSLDFFARTALIKEQSIKDKVLNALRKAGLK